MKRNNYSEFRYHKPTRIFQRAVTCTPSVCSSVLVAGNENEVFSPSLKTRASRAAHASFGTVGSFARVEVEVEVDEEESSSTAKVFKKSR
jgi:hypothetical protein